MGDTKLLGIPHLTMKNTEMVSGPQQKEMGHGHAEESCTDWITNKYVNTSSLSIILIAIDKLLFFIWAHDFYSTFLIKLFVQQGPHKNIFDHNPFTITGSQPLV